MHKVTNQRLTLLKVPRVASLDSGASGASGAIPVPDPLLLGVHRSSQNPNETFPQVVLFFEFRPIQPKNEAKIRGRFLSLSVSVIQL